MEAGLPMISVNRCIFCGKIIKDTDTVCEQCDKTIPSLSRHSCRICGHERCRCTVISKMERELDGICSCYFYEGQVRQAVSRFKFSGGRFLGQGMGKQMAQRVQEMFPDVAFDGICYVPTSLWHLFRRGYNQAAVLARVISRFTSIQVYDKILSKRRGVKTQHTLRAKERIENAKDAYRITNPKKVYGKTLLLVDDVTTTGATLRECAGELKGAGAAAVYAVCFALTPNRFERKDG